MIEEALERWAGSPTVRSHNKRAASTDAEALWEAARSIRLSDTRTLGRLVRWRIPGTPPSLTFLELFQRYPFPELEAGDTWSLSGLCGRIWTLQRDYPRLDGPQDFEAWDEPGTVKVLIANWVERDGDGSTINSEARVAPVDRRAALRLRSLWAVIGVFQRPIGGEALSLAAERAG